MNAMENLCAINARRQAPWRGRSRERERERESARSVRRLVISLRTVTSGQSGLKSPREAAFFQVRLSERRFSLLPFFLPLLLFSFYLPKPRRISRLWGPRRGLSLGASDDHPPWTRDVSRARYRTGKTSADLPSGKNFNWCLRWNRIARGRSARLRFLATT